MIQPSVDKILQVMGAKSYKVFEGYPYDLNIVGIRKDETTNKFDETLCLFYRLKGTTSPEAWHIEYHPLATKPGIPWLLKPINPKGAAIITEGQHLGVWSIGEHYKHPALVQSGIFHTIRDNNKNAVVDYDGPIEDFGPEAGLNMHGFWGPMSRILDVGYWSAGCQVIPYNMDQSEWSNIMGLFRAQAKQWGNKFSYTLLNEKDFQ